jgi:hypothetical protein
VTATQTTEATVLTCPVDDCVWTHLETMPVMPEGALANVFGPGVMAMQARNTLRERVEHALREHHKIHEVQDYLSTITRLRGEVERLGGVS